MCLLKFLPFDNANVRTGIKEYLGQNKNVVVLMDK
jgi:hypothetical protein